MTKKETVRFVKLKGCIAKLITSPPVGQLIGWVFSDNIPSFGTRIDTRNDVSETVKASIFWRTYESTEIRFIKHYLRSDLDVIELGASIGVVSSHIAQKLCAGCKLVCVEANPYIYKSIHDNLAKNASSTKCYIEQAAISYSNNEDGKTDFYMGETNLLSSLNPTEGMKVQAEATTLTAIISKYKIGQYALVMDIEGGELEIILHDHNALANCQQIIAELHVSTDGGVKFGIDDLIRLLIDKHEFALRALRGPVCVFERNSV